MEAVASETHMVVVVTATALLDTVPAGMEVVMAIRMEADTEEVMGIRMAAAVMAMKRRKTRRVTTRRT